MGKLKWVIQKRQPFVQGPPNFTKNVSFPSAFRVTCFRLPVSRPLRFLVCGFLVCGQPARPAATCPPARRPGPSRRPDDADNPRGKMREPIGIARSHRKVTCFLGAVEFKGKFRARSHNFRIMKLYVLGRKCPRGISVSPSGGQKRHTTKTESETNKAS